MTPFWNSQTTFWESSETISTTQLGYAYADFQGVDLNNPQAVQNKVISIIQQYGGATSKALPAPPSTNSTSANSTNQILNWSLRIRANHTEIHGPYSVLIFLGSVPEDPTQWLDSPNVVGVGNAFQNNITVASHQADTVIQWVIHLNDYIAANYPELGSFSEDVITPLLTDNLAWRVIDVSFDAFIDSS